MRAQAWEISFEESKETNLNADKWMTAGQILEMCKDVIVQQEIIKECKANPKLWRAHPRIPHCPEATQYYVLYDDIVQRKSGRVTQRGCTVKADLDNDAASTLMGRLAGSELSMPDQTRVNPGLATDEQAEKLRKLDAAEQARQKKQIEFAAAREQKRVTALQIKNSPAGKARAWLTGCLSTTTAIAELKGKIQTLDIGLRDLYTQKLDGHSRDISIVKSAIEQALAGSQEEQVVEDLARATAAIEAYKEDSAHAHAHTKRERTRAHTHTPTRAAKTNAALSKQRPSQTRAQTRPHKHQGPRHSARDPPSCHQEAEGRTSRATIWGAAPPQRGMNLDERIIWNAL